MLSQKENERLTRIGPGTPAGKLFRHYWWPVAFSDELKPPKPKKIRLLGEDFVLFRDGSGRLGLLELQCAHRLASLEYGRVEQDGVRCCFHGWLWDANGRCLETPCEEPRSKLRDNVRMAAYSVQEAAGLVFAYIGPQPAPLLPKYDMLMHATGTRWVWGFTDHCNWLQTIENAFDLPHLSWLHAGPYPQYARKTPKITYHDRDYGWDYGLAYDGVPGENFGSLVFPTFNRFASGRVEQVAGGRQNMIFRTPEDDTTTHNFFITIVQNPNDRLIHKTEAPPERNNNGPWVPTQRGVYILGDEEWWGVHSFNQDRMVLENQGPIVDRTREHLGTSDRGVIMYRKLLRESIKAVEDGIDPVGVVRDPQNHKVMEFKTHLHNIQPALALKLEAEVA